MEGPESCEVESTWPILAVTETHARGSFHRHGCLLCSRGSMSDFFSSAPKSTAVLLLRISGTAERAGPQSPHTMLGLYFVGHRKKTGKKGRIEGKGNGHNSAR
eukprot:scpid111896/ scgid27174/ 